MARIGTSTGVVLLAFGMILTLGIGDAYPGQKVTATTPTVTSFSGTAWNYSCSNSTWQGYLQVGYEGYQTITVSANGSGLDKVTAVSTTAPGYTVAIRSKTSTTLTLNIYGRALFGAGPYFNETPPGPVANFPLTFNYVGGAVSRNVTPGVIPAFNRNLQAWGQCTWYAGYIARLRVGKPVVPGYSSCVALSGDPNNAGFPKAYSVLNASNRHMAFLESISPTSTIKATDGSVTVTYQMSGTQYNADCKGTKSSFSTSMVVKQKNGVYTIMQTPTVIYTITAVKQ